MLALDVVAIRRGRSSRTIASAAALLALLAVVLVSPAPVPASAGTVTLNWIEWEPPASYSETSTAPSSGYGYATSALGELQLPGGSLVYVRLTGEIVDPSLGTAGPACTGYCGPSGFSSNATTRADYWQTYPASGSGVAFTSDNVPFDQLPDVGDHIGLIGAPAADGGNPTQLLEFFSDSARTEPVSVANIVMIIGSMGSGGGNSATWDFSQDIIILSDNGEVAGGSGLERTVKVPGGTGSDYQVTGDEGAGAIQILGSFTSLSWTVSAPEIWASWNVGATSASPFPAEQAAAPTVAIECRPDPVRAGEVVTCDITAGDPGIDILWRASTDATFAEAGVTLDADGRATFTFLAPRDADGRTILVELVEWGASDTVGVVGSLPGRIPAGDGPAGRTMTMVALVVGLVAAGFVGRRLGAGARRSA